ncbi:bidirectional sugar transporter SWEET5-like [Salvia divinorum]
MPSVHPDSLLVVTINSIGLIIESIYVGVFFLYSNKRRTMLLFLAGEVFFFLIVLFITFFCLHGTTNRSMLVGLIGTVMNIGMYTSTLTVMARVIKTKSVKYLPFYLTLANFANCTIWFSYALIKFDSYFLIPNGLGAVCRLVQLMLFGYYYKTTICDEEDDVDASFISTKITCKHIG